MLPMMTKKPNVTTIVAKLGGPKEEVSGPGDQVSDKSEALKGCCEKMMQAVKSDDVSAFMTALGDFCDIRESQQEASEGE
jgi:hypothetical protein